jgi:glycosyltransferase involved in cell wall biosynthesis
MRTPRNLLAKARSSWIADPNPLVSFPIATYNRCSILLERTLPSILNQSYSNIEVLIIGDSTKDCAYSRLSKLDKRVRFFNLKNRSHYPSDPFDLWCVAGYRPRNIGARISCGHYHWWISDDDALKPDSVKHLINYTRANPHIESIYGDYEFHIRNEVNLHTLKNCPSPLPFPITGMPSWINKAYLSRIYKWSGHSYQNKHNKPCDYDLQYRMWSDGVVFGYLNKVLSSVYAFPSHGWAHGSKLYTEHPEIHI